MKRTTFELRDSLNHHRYSWPETLISYPLPSDFNGSERIRLLNDQNSPVPFQLEKRKDSGDFGEYARLYLISGLPTGGSLRFTLSGDAGGSPENEEVSAGSRLRVRSEPGGVTADNGLLELTIPLHEEKRAAPVFMLRKRGEHLRGIASLRTARTLLQVSSECTAAGPVFFEYVLVYRFADEAIYRLTLRLVDGMEFVELNEEIEGFRPEEEACLTIEWPSFSPERRYTQTRGFEKLDQYLDDGGQLPFRVMPYRNWVCWQQTKTALFADRLHSAAIFIKNAEVWDDGEFALWGSSLTLAVSFGWNARRSPEDGRLSWTYPLSAGTRCTAVALYAEDEDRTARHEAHINDLWIWQELISLEKVKDWILEWDEPKEAYPRFFREDCLPQGIIADWFHERCERPTPSDMEQIVDSLSTNMNNIYHVSPVSAREFFSWAAIFDLAAPAMTQAQFERCRAAWAFMAYAHNDENWMPVRHMLAGHPNFLVDMKSVAGMMSALFPHHPHARVWKDQFERAMALNLKYHIRPDVREWEADGGRHTENLACYTIGHLNALMKPVKMIRKTWKEHPTLYPAFTKWLDWLLHSLTAPVDGNRHIPSQGAHAGGHVDDYTVPLPLRVAGEELTGFDPLLAEYLVHVCPTDARAFEEKNKGTDIWRGAPGSAPWMQRGTRPQLRSRKFTGYGFVLRSEVGAKAEMSVHLQQIDEGPNYRWGRAGEGGNGVLYYYADGRRFSFNRKEDVGDDNMGDVQACCNFGVLFGHEFRSIGRNELTEPLYDFGFAQYAKVLAGPYSRPAYRSRSVMMSGADYIVIYDQVGDMRVRGRFSWFVSENDDFPTIRQLKPGAAGYAVGPEIPTEIGARQYTNVNEESKGLHFDGHGHFLTLVTHRLGAGDDCGSLLSADATDYGAKIVLNGRQDWIFRDEAEIRHDAEGVSFTGHAGIVRLHGEHKAEAALFEGSRIGVWGVELSVGADSDRNRATHAGIGFSLEAGELRGSSLFRTAGMVAIKLPDRLAVDSFRLYVDSKPHAWRTIGERTISFTLPPGSRTWQWTEGSPVPERIRINGYVASSGQAEIRWHAAAGAERYQLQISGDGGVTWASAADDIEGIRYTLSGDNGSKRHVRVRPVNRGRLGEWSHDYPVYFTGKRPIAPDGLRISRLKIGFAVTWGEVLGADGYKLYRSVKGTDDFVPVYEGELRTYTDTNVSPDLMYEYRVSACSGNGEGAASPPRDTEPGGMTDWDPRPEETFRRDSKSFEYGYNGFDHWANERKPILTYPQDAREATVEGGG